VLQRALQGRVARGALVRGGSRFAHQPCGLNIHYASPISILQCNAPCGRQGIKYRILQCVWYGSRRPAGNVCKHQPRPAVMKVCKSPPCQAKCEYRLMVDPTGPLPYSTRGYVVLHYI